MTTERYGITRGTRHRFWSPTKSLSTTIVWWLFRKFVPPGGGGGDNYISTEYGEPIYSESGVPLEV